MKNDVKLQRAECEAFLRELDRLELGELDGQSRLEAQRHLDQCANCASEWQLRQRIKNQLRRAVTSQEVPSSLQVKIITQLHRPKSILLFPIQRQMMAIAAAVIITVGAVALYQRSRPSGGMREDEWIASLTGRVSHLLSVGLGDHLHCTVHRKFPKEAPSTAELVKHLSPQDQKIVPVLQKSIPPSMNLFVAHVCSFRNRSFLHFAARDDRNLMSLVITKKYDGERLGTDQLRPALVQSGIDIYTQSSDKFQIASFESDDYVIYVVSDLSRKENQLLMAKIAPEVRAIMNSKG